MGTLHDVSEMILKLTTTSDLAGTIAVRPSDPTMIIYVFMRMQ